MKKRVLSVLLAVLMLVSALPMVLPTLAATENEFTEADYNALYVQDKLILAVDFFSTNRYWGGESYYSEDEADGQAKINSFAFKSYKLDNTALRFNSASPDITRIENGALDTSDINQLLVDSVDSYMGIGSTGATMETVTTLKPAGGGGVFYCLNDMRYETALNLVNGTLDVKSVHLGSASIKPEDQAAGGVMFTDLAVFDPYKTVPLNKAITLSVTQYRPASTQNYRAFDAATDYEKYGVVKPEDAYTADKLHFTVGFEAVMDGDTVAAINTLAVPNHYPFFSYKPLLAELDGKKYIVGAVHRSITNEGEGGTLWHEEPGKLGIYVDGDTLFEDNNVRMPDNAQAATYLRLWNQGPDTLLNAARLYAKILSAEERAQNHFADLAKWFKLDIKSYTSLSKPDRAAVIGMMQDFTIESDRDAVAAALRVACDKIAYDFLLENLLPGDAYNVAATFVATAKEFQLSVADVKLLGEEYRAMIYTAVNGYNGVRDAESLQKVIDDKVEEIVETYFGKYIDKNEYNYRDLYVRQDELHLAVDFFDAKATDAPVYVGVSYDEWPAEYKRYNDLNSELQRWAPGQANVARNWQAMGYASLDEAFSAEAEARFGVKYPSFAKAAEAARNNRVENKRVNNWAEFAAKYVWAGDPEDFEALDISDKSYPHDNIRTFGDGKLICTLNNSVMVHVNNEHDNSDITYQVVGKIGGNWQLRGFRMAFSGATSVVNVSYAGVSVRGTEGAPTFSAGSANETFTYPTAERPTVSTVNSVDMTVSIDKRPGGDAGQYYSYEWDGSKYVVTRVPEGTSGAYGPEVFHGLMDMSIIMNGQLKDTVKNVPYAQQSSDSLGNSGANSYYAIRIYTCTLTEAEVQQNHFADLAGLYDLDLSLYYRMSPSDREKLHRDLSGVELGTDADTAVAAYEHAIRNNYYDALDTDTEAGEAFVALAEEYFLDISNLLSISDMTKERIYEIVMSDPDVASGSSWLTPILQGKVEGILRETVDEHFAESIVDTLIELRGYQLNLYGDTPGMRAIFALKEDRLGLLGSRYATTDIDVTLGVMLLPEANATDAVTVENGEIKLPESVIDSVVAYENGNTDKVFYMDNTPVYTLEYYPEGEAANEAVAYVGYICIRIEGEEPVIGYTYYSGNITKDNAFSLTELAVYAKDNLGMAHKNIQTLTNAAKDEAYISLIAGTADLSEYAICVTDTNAIAVERLQAVIKEYTGVTLAEVDAKKVDTVKHVLYFGDCDTVYADDDLYGLQVRGKNMYLFYNDADNSEAALSRFASILDMAYADGYYQLAEGASYVYHARALAAN